MKAIDRIEKGVKIVHVIFTEQQHRYLKVAAAYEGVTLSDLIRCRLADITEPSSTDRNDGFSAS